ncbi:MAG: YtxH domain-containing protein [Chitinophagales bacterium]
MRNSVKIAIGVLAGLATGAVLGVLLAPDKGKITREKIVEKGKAFSDNLKAKVEEAGAMVADVKADIRKHADKIYHN